MKRVKKTCPPVGRVALYDPFLDILGGGELHVLSILKVLDAHGYEPTIFWNSDLTKEIIKKFAFHFENNIHFAPHVFPSSPLKILQTLRAYDIFIYVTDGSYFFSSAKKNFIFCMVPDKKLYEMTLLNKLKTRNRLFITNSRFTSKWLTKWNIKNTFLHPYVGEEFFFSNEKKENIILSVGRFFSHLHVKQHEKIISSFNELQKKNKDFQSFKLVLIGGLKNEDTEYFNHITNIASTNASIILTPNVSHQFLVNYYKKARIYWHFAGFGIDEKKHPEMVEHFGIAPLQAMASGAITFCYNAGGPKEFIIENENGFLFNSDKELIEKTINLSENTFLEQRIMKNAIETSKKHFSYSVFEKQVEKIFV